MKKTTKRPSSRKPKAVPFSLLGGGGGQMLLAPPPPPTSPQPLSRLEKFERRVAAVLDRWIKAKDPRLKGVSAGAVLVGTYRAVVKRCFENNDSEAKCADELVDARKAAEKAKKKWWRPRPKTCDDLIARRFAKCKSMEMFR